MTGRREFVIGLVAGGAGGYVVAKNTGGDDGAPGGDDERTGPGETPEPGNGGDPAPSGLADEIRHEVNARREEEGGSLTPALNHDERLDDMARRNSEDMAEAGRVPDEPPEGRTVRDRYEASGYYSMHLRQGGMAMELIDQGASNVGSIEASGSGARELAEAVVDSWIRSEEDRSYIMHHTWINHGAGVASSDGEIYVTHYFS